MKCLIVAIGFLAVFSSSVFGVTKRDLHNPITVFNYAPYDIKYQIGSNLSVFYTIKKGATDTYNASVIDSHVLITVTACIDKTKEGFCSTIASHMNPQYYDATKIKSIQVRSAYDYRVTCLDGGLVSCLVP